MMIKSRHLREKLPWALQPAAAVCSGFLGFVAGGAAAMTAPIGSGSSVVVAVTGHISPRCTVMTTGSSALNLGEITNASTGRAAAVSVDLPLSLTCNTPYVASLSSKNGGLVYDGVAEPQFASLVSYAASLGMGQIAGGVSLSCDSARMRVQGGETFTPACTAASTGIRGIAAGQASVRVRLQPGAKPLLKGVYHDELILRLSPVVSG
jgi:hypothetical protein